MKIITAVYKGYRKIPTAIRTAGNRTYAAGLLLIFLSISCSQAEEESMANKENLKNKLTPQQYSVVCENGTEPPFKNAYWDNKEEGLYVDIVSGEVLFSSRDKFDSGTGWPSFTRPVDEKAVTFITDRTLGMERTEVRSSGADSHLGHVFNDGPGPGGQRYCINSASLRFIPVKDLEKEGYGDYAGLFDTQKGAAEYAVFGGGCFWGMEHIFRDIPGVLSTEVGYAGGTTENPTYEDVSSGRTGHAEVVRVAYDPTKVSYATLLDYFWRMHDPTTLNRQHNDRGTQYRSIILFADEKQEQRALESLKKFNRKNSFGKDAVTEIKKLDTFYKAEGYHQDYLVKNPGGYMCHILRDDI